MSIDEHIKKVIREEATAIAREIVQEAIAQLPKIETEGYLTIEELAIILKRGVSSVYRDAAAKRIPGYRYGDSWRFKLSEVEEACRARTLHVVDPAA